jgi:hypothetical protein
MTDPLDPFTEQIIGAVIEVSRTYPSIRTPEPLRICHI